MRLRHTSRTDPAMASNRRQVSFRLDEDHRKMVDAVVEGNEIPDIRSISDLMQDAVWLWFYEDERLNGGGGNGRGSGSDLRADPSEPGEKAG